MTREHCRELKPALSSVDLPHRLPNAILYPSYGLDIYVPALVYILTVHLDVSMSVLSILQRRESVEYLLGNA